MTRLNFPCPWQAMRFSRFCAVVFCLVMGVSPTRASVPPTPVMQHVPQAAVVGQSRLQFLFWDIYDATLFAPQGEYDPAGPFALFLVYRRAVTARDIVDASLDEMAAQQDLSAEREVGWRAALEAVMPTVQAGDTVIGVRRADGATLVYSGDRQLGVIDDTEFTKAFFDIWLGENTSRPMMRRELLGENV